MKAKKIVLMDFSENSLDKDIVAKLRSLCSSLVFASSSNKEKLLKETKDAEVLLVKYFTNADKDFINCCPNLRYMGTGAISVSNIDVAHASSKNIAVTNAAGYCDNGIAEFVFAALLSHARELEKARANVTRKNLSPDGYMGWELRGKTFGIVGLGRIGTRVAEIASAFGMRIAYFSRSRKEKLEKAGIKYMPLNELCKESDAIGIFLPEDSSTKSLIGANALNSIRQTTVIVSISHPDVFDFAKLLGHLNKGRGFLIQTYFNTIPEDTKNKLLSSKNIMLYPSIAVRTNETMRKQQEILLENVQSFLLGKPKNKVN